jgi:hypothetical protein
MTVYCDPSRIYAPLVCGRRPKLVRDPGFLWHWLSSAWVDSLDKCWREKGL